MLIAVGVRTRGSGQPPSSAMEPTGLANDITTRRSLRQWPVRPRVTEGTGGTKPVEPRCEGHCDHRAVLLVVVVINQPTMLRDGGMRGMRGGGLTKRECYDLGGHYSRHKWKSQPPAHCTRKGALVS